MLISPSFWGLPDFFLVSLKFPAGFLRFSVVFDEVKFPTFFFCFSDCIELWYKMFSRCWHACRGDVVSATDI